MPLFPANFCWSSSYLCLSSPQFPVYRCSRFSAAGYQHWKHVAFSKTSISVALTCMIPYWWVFMVFTWGPCVVLRERALYMYRQRNVPCAASACLTKTISRLTEVSSQQMRKSGGQLSVIYKPLIGCGEKENRLQSIPKSFRDSIIFQTVLNFQLALESMKELFLISEYCISLSCQDKYDPIGGQKTLVLHDGGSKVTQTPNFCDFS